MIERCEDSPGEAGSTTGPASAVPDGVQLWLVRHGETQWSRSGQHTSHTDVTLTATGQRQARALGGVLSALRPTLVLCSPRRRALDTARLAGLAVDAVDADLSEWDYGDYEGLTSAQIRQQRPHWSLWRDGVPGGESAQQVAARADAVLTRVRPHLRSGGPVVLVGHGHFSRVLGVRWIARPVSDGEHLLLDAASLCILSAQYGSPAIQRWNLPHPDTV